MQCILSHNPDIYFNLAAEEFLLKETDEDFFLLWSSEPSVVVGKHQTTLAELNYPFVVKNGIRVARRLSGGGTVFHDPGNLNFTFVLTGKEGHLINFRKYVAPVQHFLKSLEVTTQFEGHNNLTFHGFKISGNAEHVFKRRVLHHGTLLYKTHLEQLKKTLNIQPDHYVHKGVKSVPARVANLKDLVPGLPDSETFRKQFFNFILKSYEAEPYVLNRKQQETIAKLARTKYATRDWIYGYSPRYLFQKESRLENGNIKIQLKVEKGVIRQAELTSDILSDPVTQQFQSLLIGKRHSADDLTNLMKDELLHFPAIQEIKGKIYKLFF